MKTKREVSRQPLVGSPRGQRTSRADLQSSHEKVRRIETSVNNVFCKVDELYALVVDDCHYGFALAGPWVISGILQVIRRLLSLTPNMPL